MTGSTERINVALVGGGLGGLCLAVGLLKHENLNLQIYEAAHEFSEIGAGVALAENAISSLSHIDPRLAEIYEQLATTNHKHSWRNVWSHVHWGTGPKSGERVATILSQNGNRAFHRARLLDALVKLIPDGITHFGKRLTTVEQLPSGEVELRFADGTSTSADCVIGADGVHSNVRKFVTDYNPHKEPEFTQTSTTRGLIPIDQAIAAIGEDRALNTHSFVGKEGWIMWYPIDRGRTLNVNVMNTNVPEWDRETYIRPADMTRLKQIYSAWHPDCIKVIDMLSTLPEPKEWSLWQLPALDARYKDRVVLMGDAAHAMTPYHGQGAASAMEDAFVLGAIMGKVKCKDDITDAFRAFDMVRRPRAEQIKRTSREAAEVFSLRLPGVMDDPVKLRENMEWRWKYQWNWDVDAQRREAEIIFDIAKGQE